MQLPNIKDFEREFSRSLATIIGNLNLTLSMVTHSLFFKLSNTRVVFNGANYQVKYFSFKSEVILYVVWGVELAYCAGVVSCRMRRWKIWTWSGSVLLYGILICCCISYCSLLGCLKAVCRYLCSNIAAFVAFSQNFFLNQGFSTCGIRTP